MKKEKKKKPDESKYQITLSGTQMAMLSRALETLERIEIGQVHTALSLSSAWWKKDIEQCDNIRCLCDEISQKMFGFSHSGMSYGIHSKEVDNSARVMYDMQQVIRHQLWKDRENKDKSLYTVDSSPAMKTDPDNDLITVEKINGSNNEI